MKNVSNQNIFARTFILQKLEQALAEPPFENIFFATPTPLPDFPAVFYDLTRIILPLSGQKKIQFARNNKPTRQLLRPGDIFFSEKSCWSLPEWTSAHSMLSIVYSNDNSYIRFVYIDNDGTKVQNGPNIWYHTAHGLNHAAIHLLECISLLSKQPQSDKRPESLFLLKALLQISCDILKNDSPEVLSKAQRTYMQVKHHLAANLNRKINRNIVAKELQLNPSYVSRLFKKNHGDTFNHYLTELRMEQAAQLLEDKAVTVDEAAWQCGYGDTGYFIKLFKYYFGITPGQYCLKNKKYFEK